MSIEIVLEDEMHKMSQCEACFYFARSVFGGEIILVGPLTRTAIETGWGDSIHTGRVAVAFDNAKPSVINGVVHLNVPIVRESLSISGEVSEGEVYFDSLGHDLKQLP